MLKKSIVWIGPMSWLAGLVFLTAAPVRANGDAPVTRAPSQGLIAGLTPGFHIDGRFFPFTIDTSVPDEEFRLASEPARCKECSCWRAFGALVGGISGFVAYWPIAATDGRVGVSESQRLLEISAVTFGAAYLGYLIGEKFDRD